MNSKCFALLSVVGLIGIQVSALNTVDNVHSQKHRPVSCWQRSYEKDNNSEIILSDAVFPFCSHMSDSKDWSVVFVNGIDEGSDDYSTIKKIFEEQEAKYAVLNVCLQEAFDFYPGLPAQTSLRCLCRRDGCNIPKTLTEFLDFNKTPIPSQ